ncbi:MAG: phosphate signaling complex protein PhoU [Chloroflexi bacterium]|nr:phosphate signaling complex protein PhoU [Chloroflexota bacterium]MCY3937964.1 phosphate signaling complex protein PhoU [Chloroflexota bacterium]
MPRTEYENQLQSIQDELLQIGALVESSITKALDALKNRDLEVSRQVVKDDDVIDFRHQALEEQCIDVLALQQPMGGDLRTLVSVLLIASELERMGDYAEGIAKISLRMGDDPLLKPLIDIPRMGEIAIQMLRNSLRAFVNHDNEAAMQVAADDDEVDALYEQVFRELLVYMIENPGTIRRATYLIWVAHDLERIADRATNIAERVIYVTTGVLPRSV